MPLRYLWAGWLCQSADRCPLRHAGMPLEHLWAGSPAKDLSKSRQLTRTGGVSGEALPVDVLDDQTGKSHPENGGDVSQGTVDLSLFRNLVRDNLLLVV